MVEMAILSGREDWRNLQLTRIYLSTLASNRAYFNIPDGKVARRSDRPRKGGEGRTVPAQPTGIRFFALKISTCTADELGFDFPCEPVKRRWSTVQKPGFIGEQKMTTRQRTLALLLGVIMLSLMPLSFTANARNETGDRRGVAGELADRLRRQLDVLNRARSTRDLNSLKVIMPRR